MQSSAASRPQMYRYRIVAPDEADGEPSRQEEPSAPEVPAGTAQDVQELYEPDESPSVASSWQLEAAVLQGAASIAKRLLHKQGLALIAAAAASVAAFTFMISRRRNSSSKPRRTARSKASSSKPSASAKPHTPADARSESIYEDSRSEPSDASTFKTAANGSLHDTTSTSSKASSSSAKPKTTRKAPSGPPTTGPLAGLKATSACAPLADGSACVVRRKIAADNSCMFNAVGYVMHASTSKASWLRSVVAQEVSSDPETYSSVFLGMQNAAYCSWIMNPMNWGGGIELAILAKHYHCEIAAWNIESGKCHVFGEDLSVGRQVMVIYNGVHYDALAIAAHPKAEQSDDVTEFNPRTKRGKMIIAAAQKLVALNHKGARFVAGSSGGKSLKCAECGVVCKGEKEVMAHAQGTGHVNFAEVA